MLASPELKQDGCEHANIPSMHQWQGSTLYVAVCLPLTVCVYVWVCVLGLSQAYRSPVVTLLSGHRQAETDPVSHVIFSNTHFLWRKRFHSQLHRNAFVSFFLFFLLKKTNHIPNFFLFFIKSFPEQSFLPLQNRLLFPLHDVLIHLIQKPTPL